MVRESWRDGGRERDAAGEVGLDRAGQDVDRRPLRGDDQVDADRARHLREARDRGLDLGRGDHHQVGQLVDDDHVVGQRLEVLALELALALGERQPVAGFRVLDRAVVEVDRADVDLGEQPVAALHLGHRPAQRVGRLLRLDHHLGLQVRDVGVGAELDPLGVDEDELHLVAAGLVEDRGDQALQADRLARAGGAGDQQVRHGGEVGEVGLAVDGLADRQGEHRRRLPEALVGEHLAQPDRRALDVGDLDAERRAAGQAFDAHRLGAHREREVVLEVDDLAHLDARRRLELEDGDHRTGAGALDRALDAELGAARADRLAQADQLVLVDRRPLDRGVEQRDRRQRRRREVVDEGELLLRRRLAGRARRRRRRPPRGATRRTAKPGSPLFSETRIGRSSRPASASASASSERRRRRDQPVEPFLLLLALLGDPLQVLDHHAVARALLLAPLLAAGAREAPLVPGVGEAPAPARDHVARGWSGRAARARSGRGRRARRARRSGSCARPARRRR